MARRTTSIRDKRQEAEAAEARGLDKPAAKGAKTKAAGTKAPRTTRKKTKAPERKRLSWVIYSGTQKEFARFRYDQKSEAEAKLEEVKAKGRKNYYLQPVKELLSSSGASSDAAEADEDE